MTYLTEQPIAILFAGVAITLALLFIGWPSRNRAILLGAGIVAFLTALLWFTEKSIVTPKEEIEATLQQVASDLMANDAEKIVSHLSEEKVDLRAYVESQLRRIVFESASVKKNLKVTFSNEQQTRAEATFNAAARISQKSGQWKNQMVAQYFIVQFVKQNNRWLVVDYEYHDPRDGLSEK